MHLIFVHDHIFKECDGKFFSSGGLPYYIWDRYTSVFSNLTVVGRDGGMLNESDLGFSLSSNKNVEFSLMPNLSNAKDLFLINDKVKKRISHMISSNDAVIARVPSRLGAIFINEAISQNKPFAVEVVGCPWDAFMNYGTIKAKFYAPFAAIELKSILKKSYFALYVTQFFLQKRYPAQSSATIVACSNVEVPLSSEYTLKSRLEKIDNACSSEVLNFGMIANYKSKYKGIDVAIKALAKSGLSNWRIQVIGKGDPSFYIELADSLGVKSNVVFVGSVSAGASVFNWLDSIDFFLHPSFTEGMPRAIVEAMSRGCPVLASDVGGIPELLSENEMIRAGDYDDLAAKVRSLVNDKKKQKDLAIENFNFAKNYTKDVLDDKRNKFLNEFKSYIE